jgi:hypothetical protein
VTFWDKARQAASAAAVTAKETAGVAGAGVKGAAGIAKTSASGAVDRINPNTLADLIIKATLIQERTNAALREKRSAYRIAEIAITAAFPPEISFSIARIGDVDEEPGLWAAHLAAEAAQADAVAADPWQEAGATAWAQGGNEPWQPEAAPVSVETPATGASTPSPGDAAAASAPGTTSAPGTWPPSDGWQEATSGWEAAEPPAPGPESN